MPTGDSSAENVHAQEAVTSWKQHSVLVVDDEDGVRNFLMRALKPRCGRVEAVASTEEGGKLVNSFDFDLIILDILMPGKHGIEWLKELRESGFYGDVILITAYAKMETAIEALRAGAFDFILKPFRLDQILSSIARCFDRSRLLRENFVLRRERTEYSEIEGIIGDSQATRHLCAVIKQLAPLPSTVMLYGESGTGKEIAARALHRMSDRCHQPFAPLNCGAISPELIESELFGHAKGAFTGATLARKGLFFYATGGTLFLDEIGELPLPAQAKLLRALEEKTIRPVGSDREVQVDVRVIAATHRDLQVEVAAGRFRHDLFYRLDVVNIHIPPLRDRPEDIRPLAEHFMKQLSLHLGLPPLALTADVVEKLRGYHWPGNARELRNVIERSVILGYIPVDQLRTGPSAQPTAARAREAPITLAGLEKQHILGTLDEVGGNKAEAARRLGISVRTLERRCAQWSVQ
ncbi:MAG: sigma-54-dependent transcriptional regulator [Gammaproteobacteria bacterium]